MFIFTLISKVLLTILSRFWNGPDQTETLLMVWFEGHRLCTFLDQQIAGNHRDYAGLTCNNSFMTDVRR